MHERLKFGSYADFKITWNGLNGDEIEQSSHLHSVQIGGIWCQEGIKLLVEERTHI